MRTLAAGLRYQSRDDLALLEFSEKAQTVAVFTQSLCCAAPVILAREYVEIADARALLINAGRGELVDAAVMAVNEVTGVDTQLSTAGGTSDGRFIAPTGAQVAELGPVNATIHKLNEQVIAADLPRLAEIYRRILERLLLPQG